MPHTPTPARREPSAFADPLQPRNPLVSRRWLAAGTGLVVLAAAVLGYLTLLLLFWQGQWQILFHPSRTVAITPASHGLAYDDVHFGAAETGQLELTGWWVPATPNAADARLTVLYLHAARGSLSDALPQIEALHALGVQVFAFDPRGYGNSVWARPSEERWDEDAEAAFRYLTETRHLDPHTIVLGGEDLGATVAAETAAQHPFVPAVILVDPQPPGLELLKRDPRSRFVPLSLLARDDFDPSEALASSAARKLFIAPSGPDPVPYAQHAAPPKVIVRSSAPPGKSLLSDSAAEGALRQLLNSVSITF